MAPRSLEQRNVIGLFAEALRIAIERFSAQDVADLVEARKLASEPPWFTAERAELLGLFGALASKTSGRWTLSGPVADQILTILGGPSARELPRPMFVLARAIDDSYDAETFTEADRSYHAASDVMPPSRSFFEDAANLPPPVGRMSALAAARPFFRNLWLLPRVAGWNPLGRFPEAVRVTIPDHVHERLTDAREERRLRLALVMWRDHDPYQLQRAKSRRGTFAITAFANPARPNLAADVVAALADRQTHLALLPELALDSADLTALQSALRAAGRAHPTLVIAGLMHESQGDGHRNQAVVLDGRTGNELFRHEKFEPFPHKDWGTEDILPIRNPTYRFADTPIGRLVVNICRDFRSDVAMILNRVLEPTLLAVPAYSPMLRFASEEASFLGQRHAAITLAVNPLAPPFLRDAGYAYAPIKGTKAETDRSYKGEELTLQSAIQPAGSSVGIQHLIMEMAGNTVQMSSSLQTVP